LAAARSAGSTLVRFALAALDRLGDGPRAGDLDAGGVGPQLGALLADQGEGRGRRLGLGGRLRRQQLRRDLRRLRQVGIRLRIRR
jgi:hypothetical protein